MFIVYICTLVGCFVVARGITSSVYLAWDKAIALVRMRKMIKKINNGAKGDD